MKPKNLFGKSVEVDNAYATYRAGAFEWKVLKTYQEKGNEDKNKYARWFTACKSPMTYDSWEYGDAYISDIMQCNPTLISSTNEWDETYRCLR